MSGHTGVVASIFMKCWREDQCPTALYDMRRHVEDFSPTFHPAHLGRCLSLCMTNYLSNLVHLELRVLRHWVEL